MISDPTTTRLTAQRRDQLMAAARAKATRRGRVSARHALRRGSSFTVPTPGVALGCVAHAGERVRGFSAPYTGTRGDCRPYPASELAPGGVVRKSVRLSRSFRGCGLKRWSHVFTTALVTLTPLSDQAGEVWDRTSDAACRLGRGSRRLFPDANPPPEQASLSHWYHGEPVGIRTRDVLIKSQLLYWLRHRLAARGR